MRRVLVLVLLGALAGCASSKAPPPSAAARSQPSAAVSQPSAAVSPSAAATVIPRLTPRAHCFQSKGVWRAAAGNCEYESPD